ncbi:hypothetical protein ARSQ2_01697 [Arsenophonus endosymbiont of Bemisia tabaci Q2]|nr:hypothetical protein ARSQ2_01697 [Arsenophonus endosymbiont of Bemisia tabaci Q2]
MRHRYFVRTQYGVIKIQSLSYKSDYRQERIGRFINMDAFLLYFLGQ